MAPPRIPVEQRFWSKVDKRGPDECWPWLANRVNGYGRISVSAGVSRPAHRVAWELSNRCAFPADKQACHSCDNPRCVNPAHIWPGTAQENTIDAFTKGRRVPFTPPLIHIDIAQAHAMRRAGHTHAAIGKALGCGRSTIRRRLKSNTGETA